MNLAAKLEYKETKELSVREISAIIKKNFDDNFGFIKVRGEISGLKIAASGHAYFNLKDNDAILACTCWKPILARVPFKLEDGLEIIVSGRLTIFAGQSKYQLSAEIIELAGSGALMELLRKRKEQFEKEGLFDQSRKKKIPFLPEKIAIITSPVGAVLHDILHRIRERFPVTIMLWPVAVQGEACAFEVSSAINNLNNLEKSKKPDLIIIARGGGSIEDLWGFNEEIVVRAAANCSIPIISAIGHETDFTLLDFVSDLRAPTPTAAAEFAVPVKEDLYIRLLNAENRFKQNFNNIIKHATSSLHLLSARFLNFERFTFTLQQRFDEINFRLATGLPNLIKVKKNSLSSIKLPISSINNLFEKKNTQYLNLFDKIKFLSQKIISGKESKLELQAKLIESMSIKQILKRGFAIIRSKNGKVLPNLDAAKNEYKMEIEWNDGKLNVEQK